MVVMAGLNYVTLYLKVFIGKICRSRIVCIDASDFCGSKHHHIGLLRLKKIPDCLLVCQVKFAVRPANNIFISLCLQVSHNGRSHQSPVPCHIDFI